MTSQKPPPSRAAVFVYSGSMSEVPSNPEAAPPIVPIPDEVVSSFIDGAIGPAGAERVYTRYYERPVQLPGVPGDSRLVLVYEKNSGSETLSFNYVNVPPGEQGEQYIASMILNVKDKKAFTLPHRKVDGQRGQGLGTALLREAEGWIRQVVERRKHPISLSVETSQYDVIKWLTKLGYEPTEESRELYDDLMANIDNPDRYIVDPGLGDHLQRPLSIFPVTPEGTRDAMPIRLTMVQTFNPNAASGTSPSTAQ